MLGYWLLVSTFPSKRRTHRFDSVWSEINNYIAQWRLGAWDVQGLPMEAGQQAPGPRKSPMAGNPRNPGIRAAIFSHDTIHVLYISSEAI